MDLLDCLFAPEELRTDSISDLLLLVLPSDNFVIEPFLFAEFRESRDFGVEKRDLLLFISGFNEADDALIVGLLLFLKGFHYFL